jgi:serine O-acetyltransferase
MTSLWTRAREDVRRHEGWSDPAVWPLLVHRLGRTCDELPAPLRKLASKLYGATALGVELATGTRLHRETEVGEGLHLIHGRNVRVHPRAVIGARVTLMHDVTIGTGMDDPRAPVLEDDVFVGAGAKILGGVRIGRGARIAANSLVITDIPPGARAMGVPARPLPTRTTGT